MMREEEWGDEAVRKWMTSQGIPGDKLRVFGDDAKLQEAARVDGKNRCGRGGANDGG